MLILISIVIFLYLVVERPKDIYLKGSLLEYEYFLWIYWYCPCDSDSDSDGGKYEVGC